MKKLQEFAAAKPAITIEIVAEFTLGGVPHDVVHVHQMEEEYVLGEEAIDELQGGADGHRRAVSLQHGCIFGKHRHSRTDDGLGKIDRGDGRRGDNTSPPRQQMDAGILANRRPASPDRP